MSLSTGLAVITPIEQVTVPGWATMASAAIEMKYPPDAATSLIDTTTGLPALRALTTSRQIESEATYEPPGLFTRSTMALTRGSAVAARRAAVMLSEPIAVPVSGLRPFRPRLIAPVAWITATAS